MVAARRPGIAAVSAATERYRTEMDLVADFIEDCCTRNPEATETATALYDAFQRYCRAMHEQPISSTVFGTALTQKGFEAVRTAAMRGRKGLALAPDTVPPSNDGFAPE